MPLPEVLDEDEATVEVPTLEAGTMVTLDIEQFAQSFKGHTFMVDFCHTTGTRRQPAQIVGHRDGHILMVVVPE